MGLGINLGNTLDAVGDWIDPSNILNYEQAWGSPIITQEIIEGYAKAGYSSLRIPVSWGNLLSDDFKVHPDLMDRVENPKLDPRLWHGGYHQYPPRKRMD